MSRRMKPTEVKRAQGNPGKRALADPVILSGKGIPMKPDGLSDRASELWDLRVPDLARAGVLDKCEIDVLIQFFEAIATAEECARLIANHGPVLMLPNNSDGSLVPKKNPAVTAWKDAVQTARLIAVEYGLTPSSRSKLASLGYEGADPADVDDEAPPSVRQLRAVDGGAS